MLFQALKKKVKVQNVFTRTDAARMEKEKVKLADRSSSVGE